MTRAPASKLNSSQVRAMRQRYLNGWTQSKLANEYAISVGHVGRIIRGDVWQTRESGWQETCKHSGCAMLALETGYCALHRGPSV